MRRTLSAESTLLPSPTVVEIGTEISVDPCFSEKAFLCAFASLR